MIRITTTHRPATDLGYLLHKNPARVHEAELSCGTATLFFSEATEERATACILLDVQLSGSWKRDPRNRDWDQPLQERPYVASSYLSTALAELAGSALNGRCRDKPELADTPIPLEIFLPALPSRKGGQRIVELFEPLGWDVEVFPLRAAGIAEELGIYEATLRGTQTLASALRALYVLIPVLDERKHYYMSPGEVDILVAKGKGWLESHPLRQQIVRSSLRGRPSLQREALERLVLADDAIVPEVQPEGDDELQAEEAQDKKASLPRLHVQRHRRVAELVKERAPESLLDFGCGSGELARLLLPIRGLKRIVGMDVDYWEVEKAKKRLHLEDAAPRLRDRVEFFHGSLTYKDPRFQGFDMATVVEVVEHFDPPRLIAFEKILFGYARPNSVILTTPNREFNAHYGLEGLRHKDHRFEWTRAEFAEWTQGVAERHGYQVRIKGIGDPVEPFGPPSLLAEFTR